MGWSVPSNNTGILTRPNADTTFIVTGTGSHDIIVAEPVFGAGTMEVVRLRNDGGGRYLITIRAGGSALLRVHGESVN
jgi:hypothetical protein